MILSKACGKFFTCCFLLATWVFGNHLNSQTVCAVLSDKRKQKHQEAMQLEGQIQSCTIRSSRKQAKSNVSATYDNSKNRETAGRPFVTEILTICAYL